MSHVFESTHPLVRHKLTVLRQTGTGVRRFRELVWELTTLLACTLPLHSRIQVHGYIIGTPFLL